MRTTASSIQAALACAVLLFTAGCTTPDTAACNPACTGNTVCASGACVPSIPFDFAMSIDMAANCAPACSGLTPYCSQTHQCVACLTDDHCPVGQICKSGNLGNSCVPGCKDDARCGKKDGGAGGIACCGMACVDTAIDSQNCGGCGKICSAMHAQPVCAAGACQTGKCDPGWDDCNKDPKDGCESNLHADPMNCTACGMGCDIKNAIPGCADGCYIKACKFGFDDCNQDPKDGCETPTATDPNNCGGCGNACKGVPHTKVACLNASCAVTSCDVGYADCDNNGLNGCETGIFTDPKNCGACNNACGNGLVCVNGGCTCQQCNIPNAKTACMNNQCVLVSCLPGFGDCDNNPANGCEANFGFDKNNCGQCGAACPMNTPYCANGACANINTNVLLVAASSYAADVQARIMATGAFQKVDLFNGQTSTPTVQQLAPYGAIMLFSDSGFADAAALGDNVATYYDNGGQVVIATFANASVPVRGRFGTVANGYMLIDPAGQDQPNDTLGTIVEMGSPLVAGLTKMSAQAAYRSTGGPVNGGVVVAKWGTGSPLVVRGVIKGRNRADLNFYPPSSAIRGDFWTGDGDKLMRNALLYR